MKHSLNIFIVFLLCLSYRLTAQKVPHDLPSLQQLLIQLKQIRADMAEKGGYLISDKTYQNFVLQALS